jgi:indole-3-glycerol phosphate synthase
VVRDFSCALKANNFQLITEVKRASPSKGIFLPDYNPVQIAMEYANEGAAAISVLTEKKYFGGSIEHLSAIKRELSLPLLRKDFIFDPYQVYESRACGADALLLIAAVLSIEQLKELLLLSHSLELKCLVEIHSEAEIELILPVNEIEIIGINNRDLSTFNVDIDTTRRLRPLIPPDKIVISESGIKDCNDVRKLKEWGVNAALIGEALLTANNISSKMKELLS